MKIDFRNIKVYKDLKKTDFELVNLQESVANTIYGTGQGVAAASMCTRVYESKDGIVEFNDNEVAILREIIDKSSFAFIIMAIHDIIDAGGNVPEENTNEKNN